MNNVQLQEWIMFVWLNVHDKHEIVGPVKGVRPIIEALTDRAAMDEQSHVISVGTSALVDLFMAEFFQDLYYKDVGSELIIYLRTKEKRGKNSTSGRIKDSALTTGFGALDEDGTSRVEGRTVAVRHWRALEEEHAVSGQTVVG
jgi:hypothetical protein